jgi:hypothetical protein
LDCPRLTKELASEIETLWRDDAIQVAVASNMLIALHQSHFLSSYSVLVFCIILIKLFSHIFVFVSLLNSKLSMLSVSFPL